MNYRSISFYISVGVIDEQSQQLQIKVSPNTASDFFWLDYHLSNSISNGALIIYTTLGDYYLTIIPNKFVKL